MLKTLKKMNIFWIRSLLLPPTPQPKMKRDFCIQAQKTFQNRRGSTPTKTRFYLSTPQNVYTISDSVNLTVFASNTALKRFKITISKNDGMRFRSQKVNKIGALGATHADIRYRRRLAGEGTTRRRCTRSC